MGMMVPVTTAVVSVGATSAPVVATGAPGVRVWMGSGVGGVTVVVATVEVALGEVPLQFWLVKKTRAAIPAIIIIPPTATKVLFMETS